jgi:hypothetical protein
MSYTLKSKIWSICLATWYEIVSLSWIHCNPKPTTPCPSSSYPRSSPWASLLPWNCFPLLNPLQP